MKEQFRKFQMIASLTLGSLPIAVMLFAYMEPSLLSWAWVYPAAYGVFSMLGIWIPKRSRLLYGIVMSVVSLALSVLLAKNFNGIPLLIAAALYLVLFLWSLTICAWPSNRELPALLRLACFALHMVAQFAVSMDRVTSQPVLASQALGLNAAFIAFLFLLPFSMNRGSINKASTKTRSVPNGTRRKNTWMTLILVVLACLASFIPYVYDWMKKLILWFAGMLLRLLAPEPSDPHVPPDTPATGAVGEMIIMTETEPSGIAEFLEFIMLVLGVSAIVALLVLFIVLLIRKLKRWVVNAWEMLEKYAGAVSEDYEDEITDTRGESSGERIGKKRIAVHWEKEQIPASPSENIRYRYRRLLRKHPEWTANTTARENLPRNLAEIYEQARYSGRTVTESEAELFRTESAKQ